MAALTSDANIARRNVYPEMQGSLLVKSNTTIYGMSLVSCDASGLLIPSTDTSGTAFVGIAVRQVVNPAGGSLLCPFEYGMEALLTQDGSLAVTDQSSQAIVVVLDSGTVAKTSSNSIKVGRMVEFVSATQVWVRLTVGNP